MSRARLGVDVDFRRLPSKHMSSHGAETGAGLLDRSLTSSRVVVCADAGGDVYRSLTDVVWLASGTTA